MTFRGLVLAWIAIFLLRILLGDGGTIDVVALWLLRLLSVAIAVQFLRAAIRLLKDLASAAKREEQVFTQGRVRLLLLGGLAVGLACRIWAWGSGGQGIVGWTGAILVCLSLVGLGSLYVRQIHHRRHKTERITFWHPYCRVALVVTWVASLVALGIAKPTGVSGGLLVALFWLSLIALAVQLIGGKVHRYQESR
jgi:hypothetical protein